MAVAFRASAETDLEQLFEVWSASVSATHQFLSGGDLREIAEETGDVLVESYLELLRGEFSLF